MWTLSLPWYEFVARGLVIYFFLVVALRLTSRRQIGQLAPFDLVLLLIISNAVQNSMNGGDNSVLGGLILSLTLFTADSIVSFITFKSKRFEAFVEGEPVVLISSGQLNLRKIQQLQVTEAELMASVRAAGCEFIEQVKLAILETNGKISVIRAAEKSG